MYLDACLEEDPGDGSVVRVQSGTEMQVERQRNYPDVGILESVMKVISGRVESLVQKFRSGDTKETKQTRHSINTQLANLAVRGTEYRVTMDPKTTETRGEVLSGAVAVVAGVTAALRGSRGFTVGVALMGALAVAGAFVAARQSFLQWYPPEVLSCGRDLYGMIESFPLKRVIPMIFKGSGDCSVIDWTFLGLTIANWSFLCFSGIAALSALLLWRRRAA